MTTKNIVLLGKQSRSTSILYNSLRTAFPVSKAILEDSEPKLTFLKRRIRRLGIAKTLGQVAFRTTVVPWLELTSQKRVREILVDFGLDPSPIPYEERIRVKSANSAECIAALIKLRPDIVVISGTRILSKKLLSSTSAVFINVHAGITPLYRGCHGAYWALVQGDRDGCGVTVHQVDTGVDTGAILGQARIVPQHDDNLSTYGILQQAAGLPLLKKAIRDTCEGRIVAVAPPPGTSRMWTHPTLIEYINDRFRRGVK
jgi:folate-dependent phosphoribosylglycinamide formyltransferase PurN